MSVPGSLLAVLTVFSTLSAGSITQEDWTGGPGVSGTVISWGDSFDTQNNLYWWDASGTLSIFDGPGSQTIGEGGNNAVFGDLEPDGDWDMFLRGDYGHIYLYINKSDTWERTDSFVSNEYCYGVGMGSGVDSDGDLDLFVSKWFAPTLKVTNFIRNDYPSWPTVTISEFAYSDPFEIIDIDMDGSSDFLGRSGSNYKWFRNEGNGSSWTYQGTFFQNVVRIASSDLDSDMDEDLVMLQYDGLNWVENDGTGNWILHTIDSTLEAGSSSLRPGFADLNSDGELDIIGNVYSAIVWWENNTGSGDPWIRHTVDDLDNAASVDGGDLDGDGDDDLLTGSGSGLYWWENLDGSGNSWACHELAHDDVKVVKCCQIVEGGQREAVMVSTLGSGSNCGVSKWYSVNGTPASSGALQSSILEMQQAVQWDSLFWSADTPSGTSVGFQLRSGSSHYEMKPWSDTLYSFCSLEGILEDDHRYLQYRAILSSIDTNTTPELHSVTITWDDLGISQQEEAQRVLDSSFRVYPIPSNGSPVAEFMFSGESGTSLMVYDISGKVALSIPQQELTAGMHSIQLEGLSPGVYFCRIQVEDVSLEKRFVVIR